MAADPKPVKPSLARRMGQRVGKASNWLPGLAAFLCLCLFALAVVTLLDVNSEPVTGQRANVTSVSAQGVAGLRRMLAARGHEIVVNRMEDGPQLAHGDLEIITLDSDGGALLYGYDDSHRQSSSSSASESSAEESAAVANEAAASGGDNSAVASSAAESADSYDFQPAQVPDPKRAGHILDHPLGKVVLVVAPKWDAFATRTNPHWDQGAEPVPAAAILQTLTILSPVSVQPAPEFDPDGPDTPRPPVDAGQERRRAGQVWVTYDTPQYELKRDFKVITTGTPAGQNTHNEPVVTDVTLTPAPGQALLTAPLKVGKIGGLQSITGPNLRPVLLGPNGEAVLSRVIVTGGRPQPKVPVYLLSDPDLLNNQILGDPQRVVAALTLTETLAGKPAGIPGTVIFNLTFNGMAFDHDLLHALSRPPFVGVPLCLLIAGLGLMWAAFSRFGPAREVPAGAPLGRGVRILADNAARLMAITLKEARLGPAYADLVRDQALKDKGYVAGIRTESPDDLAERIGKAHKTTDSFIDLKARAARVATVHQLIDITLKLHAWKTEIQRAHT